MVGLYICLPPSRCPIFYDPPPSYKEAREKALPSFLSSKYKIDNDNCKNHDTQHGYADLHQTLVDRHLR